MSKSVISAILPFSEDVSDPLFVEVSERLKAQGNPLNDADLYQIYLETRGHIVYAASTYGRFWEKFKYTEEIVVSRPLKSLFIRIYLHSNLSLQEMSLETRSRSFQLLATRTTPAIAQATSAFLTAEVRALKQPDEALQLAPI